MLETPLGLSFFSTVKWATVPLIISMWFLRSDDKHLMLWHSVTYWIYFSLCTSTLLCSSSLYTAHVVIGTGLCPSCVEFSITTPVWVLLCQVESGVIWWWRTQTAVTSSYQIRNESDRGRDENSVIKRLADQGRNGTELSVSKRKNAWDYTFGPRYRDWIRLISKEQWNPGLNWSCSIPMSVVELKIIEEYWVSYLYQLTPTLI